VTRQAMTDAGPAGAGLLYDALRGWLDALCFGASLAGGVVLLARAHGGAQITAVRHQEVVAGQLQVALNSRVIIEQAKGVLAERLRVTPDEAFVTLRRYARDHNHPLTQLSGDVIRGTARITGDG
jgi:hypothetical protein